MATDTLRRHARLLMWLVTIPFACLCLLAIVLLGNIAWQGGRYADSVAVYYLPMALYMWAMWMIRSALGRIAAGELFADVLPTLLFRVGSALLAGGLFTVFGVPVMTALIWGSPYIRTFEPSPVMVGVIGAALMLLARLFARAVAMRDEVEGFF